MNRPAAPLPIEALSRLLSVSCAGGHGEPDRRRAGAQAAHYRRIARALSLLSRFPGATPVEIEAARVARRLCARLAKAADALRGQAADTDSRYADAVLLLSAPLPMRLQRAYAELLAIDDARGGTLRAQGASYFATEEWRYYVALDGPDLPDRLAADVRFRLAITRERIAEAWARAPEPVPLLAARHWRDQARRLAEIEADPPALLRGLARLLNIAEAYAHPNVILFPRHERHPQ
jgi:hypothetical protein